MSTNEIQCSCGHRFKPADPGALKGLLQCSNCGKALVFSKGALPRHPRSLGVTLLILLGFLGIGVGGATYFFRDNLFGGKSSRAHIRRSPIGPMAPRPGSMAEMAGGPGSVDETLLFPPGSGILAIQLGEIFKAPLFQEILEENKKDLDEARDKTGLDLRQIDRMHFVLLAEEFLNQANLYLKGEGDFTPGGISNSPMVVGPAERQIRTGPTSDRNRPGQGVAASASPPSVTIEGIPDFLVVILTFRQPQDWAQSVPRGMRKISAVANAPGTTFDIGRGAKLHLCPGEKTALVGGITGLEKFMYLSANGPEGNQVARVKKGLATGDAQWILEVSGEMLEKAMPGYAARLNPPFNELKNFLGSARDFSMTGKVRENILLDLRAEYPNGPSAEKSVQEIRTLVGLITNPQQRAMLGALAFANKGRDGAVLALYADTLAQLKPEKIDQTIVQNLAFSGPKLKRAMAGAFKYRNPAPSRENQDSRSRPLVTSD